MAVITLPSSGRAGSFTLSRSQAALLTVAGVTQITTFPDRRWYMTLEIPPTREASGIRQWMLAMIQLSNLENKFAFGPPWYTGPSTGYSGSSPLVDGASQLGLSLNVKNLAFSTAILLAGDFISFDVTSVGGETNRQLIQVASDVTSNGTGLATISLVQPIRQAPADNAAVNINTPTAFFRFVTPKGGVDRYEVIFAGFNIDAEEIIAP